MRFARRGIRGVTLWYYEWEYHDEDRGCSRRSLSGIYLGLMGLANGVGEERV